MPKLSNKIDNKYDEQFIVVQTTIEANKQDIKANKKYFDDNWWRSYNT